MRIFAAIFFIVLSLSVKAQSPLNLSMYQYEDSLKKLGTIITNDTIEYNRVQANYTFIRTLTSALQLKGSFNYSFSKLNGFISVKQSPDRKFKLFSWFVFHDNGNFRYYGAIQLNNPQKLELIPLIDNASDHEEPEIQTFSSDNWFGAVYYDIVTVNVKNPYYILLGWKGIDMETSSKVIETLRFSEGKAIFGSPVFESRFKSEEYLHRKIFTYSSHVSMLLRHSKSDRIFVFDHLVPQDPKKTTDKSQYIPDLSYDGYRFRNNKWTYLENLNMKNLPDEKDDMYIDPTKF